MTHSPNPNDIFWLARYAYNTMAPLVAATRQYDPSTYLKIEVTFAATNGEFPKRDALGVHVYSVAGGHASLLIHSFTLTTKAEVDREAAKLQAWIDAEQAKIEERHDLEAFYGLEQADAAEAADWELQQDRIRERADIERDEDAHDIELQNVAAGN